MSQGFVHPDSGTFCIAICFSTFMRVSIERGLHQADRNNSVDIACVDDFFQFCNLVSAEKIIFKSDTQSNRVCDSCRDLQDYR